MCVVDWLQRCDHSARPRPAFAPRTARALVDIEHSIEQI